MNQNELLCTKHLVQRLAHGKCYKNGSLCDNYEIYSVWLCVCVGWNIFQEESLTCVSCGPYGLIRHVLGNKIIKQTLKGHLSPLGLCRRIKPWVNRSCEITEMLSSSSTFLSWLSKHNFLNNSRAAQNGKTPTHMQALEQLDVCSKVSTCF